MTAATLAVRVARKTAEAEDVCSLELVSADGRPLPAWTAGAHIDVHLPGGLVRQYSLCGVPGPALSYHLGVLREPASRGGSRAVHEALRPGDRLAISHPRNAFALDATAASHLLLAGGIGITPLLAMAEALHARGTPFRLHYATRTAARTAFAGRLSAAPWAAAVRLHRDDGPPAQRLDLPRLLAEPQPGQHLSVCGPAGLIEAALSTARRLGWPEAQLHAESFSPAPPAAAAGERAFELQLARSGRQLTVAPGQRITDVLQQAGVFVPTSCEQGLCGTCLTPVLAGTPEHRDAYLTPEERTAGNQCLPCCARSLTPVLVLDL